jgi:type IV secretion system protein VirB6
MSLLNPIGSFLTTFDTAINTAQTTAVSGLVAALPAPLASMGVIYFAFMGWRVARGDLQQVHDFTVHMAKLGFIFYLACNLAAFNHWVVGLFQLGIANALTTAVASSGSTTATTVNSVASALDNIWASMWSVAATAWAQAGTFDVSTRVVAFASVVGGGVGLALCAGVYLISRFLLAIVTVLGPVAISLAMYPSTRPIFERWVGKGISLIILQVSAVITMQIVIAGDQTFMAALNPASATPDLPTQLQNLLSMAIWLMLGAFAIYSLPVIAYSIGTGVTTSLMPVALALANGAGLAGSLLPSGSGGGSNNAPFEGGELNLSLARAELSGGGMAGLPSPPPPALPFAGSSSLPSQGA